MVLSLREKGGGLKWVGCLDGLREKGGLKMKVATRTVEDRNRLEEAMSRGLGWDTIRISEAGTVK